VRALRAKSVGDVLKAASETSFPPNVDGWLFPQDVFTIFANGKQNDVPLIAGSNADEGTALSPWPANRTAADFKAQTQRLFGDRTGQFLKFYPAGSDGEARAAHYASYRDFSFGWQMRTWVRMAAKTGKSNAYLYYFTRVPPGPASTRLKSSRGRSCINRSSISWTIFSPCGAASSISFRRWDRKRAYMATACFIEHRLSYSPISPPHSPIRPFRRGCATTPTQTG